MRRPHLSTGAWIFASAVTVAAIAAPVSYAAVTSTVAIGNASGSTTAGVTTQHQLLSTPIAPTAVIRLTLNVTPDDNCHALYTPPTGKALVMTSVTYDVGYSSSASPAAEVLTDPSCAQIYDFVTTSDPLTSQEHTFPTGLPVASLSGFADGEVGLVTVVGYLIPAGQLPADPPAMHGRTPSVLNKVLPATRSH